jgi:hypothetical protein
VAALTLTAVLASCAASSPGTAETDRIATTVAAAISGQRQASADGLVRAALATQAGTDTRLVVVEAQDLHADELVDPRARLVFRVHLDASGSGLSASEPVTACYQARFNFYGVVGRPRRIDCPAGAEPIVPPPLAPVARVTLPSGFEGTLTETLAGLPAGPSAEEVVAAVASALPAPGADPNTGLTNLAPMVDATVVGSDVGVSLWAAIDRDCLLGARVDGQVSVGSPSRVQMQPGELTCDPQTALHLSDLTQPH